MLVLQTPLPAMPEDLKTVIEEQKALQPGREEAKKQRLAKAAKE
jgi:hypothetical protein